MWLSPKRKEDEESERERERDGQIYRQIDRLRERGGIEVEEYIETVVNYIRTYTKERKIKKWEERERETETEKEREKKWK